MRCSVIYGERFAFELTVFLASEAESGPCQIKRQPVDVGCEAMLDMLSSTLGDSPPSAAGTFQGIGEVGRRLVFVPFV